MPVNEQCAATKISREKKKREKQNIPKAHSDSRFTIDAFYP